MTTGFSLTDFDLSFVPGIVTTKSFDVITLPFLATFKFTVTSVSTIGRWIDPSLATT